MNWVCYIVQCDDGTLYTGITNDLDRRIAAHNAGEGAKYTRGRTPVQVAHVEACAGKPEALKREREIKRMTRSRKQMLCGDARQRKPVK